MKIFYLLLSDGQIQSAMATSIMDTPTKFDDLDVVAAGCSLPIIEKVKDALRAKESYSVDPKDGLELVA